MLNQFETPILFLIFNRPDTTSEVFSKIKEIRPKYLYVAADGPRNNKEGEKELCDQTRQLVLENIDWECEVKTLLRNENLGCQNAVSQGISWFFENVEQGIIIEDDIIPDLSFFQYCEELLNKYKHDSRIMMITGTNYYQDKLDTEFSYFFSQHYTIWGWATWKRAWKQYDVNINYYDTVLKNNELENISPKWYIKLHYERTFDYIKYKNMDTWDIQWVFCCLLNHGLCICPSKNLISNIGVVGTHSHKQTNSHFFPTYKCEFPLKHPKYIHPYAKYDLELHKKYFGINIKSFIIQKVVKLIMILKLDKIVKKIYHKFILGRK